MDMPGRTVKKYTNRNIEAAEAIEELIEIGKKVKCAFRNLQEKFMVYYYCYVVKIERFLNGWNFKLLVETWENLWQNDKL